MSGTPPEKTNDRWKAIPKRQEYSKPKGGRPKLPDGQQRTHAVKVYFDEENYAKLLKRRKRTGKPLSSIVYELAVNGYVREPLSKELASCVRAMASMANQPEPTGTRSAPFRVCRRGGKDKGTVGKNR